MPPAAAKAGPGAVGGTMGQGVSGGSRQAQSSPAQSVRAHATGTSPRADAHTSGSLGPRLGGWALLLGDLLGQHLPAEVGLEELLQAGRKDGQLLRVEVFLGGETTEGMSPPHAPRPRPQAWGRRGALTSRTWSTISCMTSHWTSVSLHTSEEPSGLEATAQGVQARSREGARGRGPQSRESPPLCLGPQSLLSSEPGAPPAAAAPGPHTPALLQL